MLDVEGEPGGSRIGANENNPQPKLRGKDIVVPFVERSIVKRLNNKTSGNIPDLLLLAPEGHFVLVFRKKPSS